MQALSPGNLSALEPLATCILSISSNESSLTSPVPLYMVETSGSCIITQTPSLVMCVSHSRPKYPPCLPAASNDGAVFSGYAPESPRCATSRTLSLSSGAKSESLLSSFGTIGFLRIFLYTILPNTGWNLFPINAVNLLSLPMKITLTFLTAV